MADRICILLGIGALVVVMGTLILILITLIVQDTRADMECRALGYQRGYTSVGTAYCVNEHISRLYGPEEAAR
ncbi:MAG: hypothetical protein IT318_20150 [Anaerolineales bacterium]|nr:hypothetical protein [Anaerolineales bacterium]